MQDPTDGKGSHNAKLCCEAVTKNESKYFKMFVSTPFSNTSSVIVVLLAKFTLNLSIEIVWNALDSIISFIIVYN